MGQQLVITVQDCGEEICKIYYHWSAYSRSALMKTRDVLNVLFDEENDIKDLRLRMIRFCECNGGGIDGGKDSDEWKYIQEVYPHEAFKSNYIDRNYGLIAISEKGMDDIQYWSEGDIIIRLDDDEIINFVNCVYHNIDDYNKNKKEWYDDWTDISLEDIPELECNLCDFHYEDIDYLIKALGSAPNFVVRYGNEIYELIE